MVEQRSNWVFGIKYFVYLLFFSGVFTIGFLTFLIFDFGIHGIISPFTDFPDAIGFSLYGLRTFGLAVIAVELGFIFALVAIYFFTKNNMKKYNKTMQWWIGAHLLFLPIGHLIGFDHFSYKWQIPIYFPTLVLFWLAGWGLHKFLRRTPV